MIISFAHNSLDSVDSLLFTVIILSLIALFAYLILKNPFKYPYFEYEFDVSSKRNVQILDYIDNFLNVKSNMLLIINHERHIQEWKSNTKSKIEQSPLKKLRIKQFNDILDDTNAYVFILIRNQTRYRQKNYIKTSYKVSVNAGEYTTSFEWIKNRYHSLESIGFETTLNNYHSKNQRKLMTQSLKLQIKKRDNYTCQICGKYMPDEVGLHIDHIQPISKGGKSVASNLRVLCSKCNGSKGAKY